MPADYFLNPRCSGSCNVPPPIPDLPDQLVRAVADKNCVLFAGAGLSRGEVGAGNEAKEQYLPSWGELLNTLIERAVAIRHISAAEGKKLKNAVKDRKYLFVAETIRSRLGAREFDDVFDDIFRNANLRPTKRHFLITQIPFSAVITTNYDKLLETSYASHGLIPPVYSYDNASDAISALSTGRFFILKAHGDIDRKDTIILSERDYREMTYRQPGYRAVLNTIFISKTVLFVGTSLNDTDVNLVLETVNEAFTGKSTRHFALVPNGNMWSAETQHWRDFFGIQFLSYKPSKGHPEVEAFLEKLRDAVRQLAAVPAL